MSTRTPSLSAITTISAEHSTKINSPRPSLPTTNKALSGTSLYLSCRSVLEKLLLVPNTTSFIQSVTDGDPLNRLWNICKQGSSLVVLFNALCPENTLSMDVPSQLNKCKKNVYRFIVACRDILELKDEDLFTLSDLYTDNTSGFIRVLHTVDIVLQALIKKGIITPPKLDSDTTVSNEPKDMRDKVVLELLETERKYVLDLETLQYYMCQVQSQEILSLEAIHYMFGNLNTLVDFQRRFLIQLEETAQKAAEEQDFGTLFIQNEVAFTVYEPYCSNFFSAQDLVVQETPKLQKLACILNPVYELPSMLIKPVQRICKYPLLMQQLIKSTNAEWPHVNNMEQGLMTIRRVTEKVNETQRKHENRQILEQAKRRMDELSPAEIDSFGSLLLYDKVMMSRSESPEKEVHVYLFEKTIMMCKEIRDSIKNMTSTISIKKKRRASLEPSGIINNKHIWNIRNHLSSGNYCLMLDWKDSDVEHVSFRFQNEEKMRLWETTLRGRVCFKKISVTNSRSLPTKKLSSSRMTDSFRTRNEVERNTSENSRPKSSTTHTKKFGMRDYPTPSPSISTECPRHFLSKSQSESIVPEQALYQNRARSKSSPNIKEQLKKQPMWKNSLSNLAEVPSQQNPSPNNLKLKLSFNKGIYVIITHLNISYNELCQKATRKIRTVSTLQSTEKLKFKYQDEDGDYITVNSDEDIQMALEMRGNTNTITLFVSL